MASAKRCRASSIAFVTVDNHKQHAAAAAAAAAACGAAATAAALWTGYRLQPTVE